jgi:hypothetical protein
MTILLMKQLIQEFKFKMKFYVIMGVCKEGHGDQTFKKKQKSHYKRIM